MSTPQHPLRVHLEELIDLTNEEFEYILSHFTPIKKKKHQYLVQQGEPIKREYWVANGCIKSFTIDDSGKEHILHFGLENWWITCYDGFVNQKDANISVDCLEDCDLLYITYENRQKLSKEMLKMERFWATKTKFGYIALQNRILTLLKNTAKERYDILFGQYPELFQRVPKKLLAAYLGVSRETLSRFHN